MLRDFLRQSLASLRILVAFIVILGIGYPLVVWGAGQAFGDRADGQPVRRDGVIIGSRLIGQSFEGEEWFHSRPSPNDDDTLASAPSNLGPSSTDLLETIEQRRAEVAATESVPEADVPADAVTASGSGLDPQISPAYAEIQAARVARSNGLSVAVVQRLIDENTDGRFLGIHGEPGVNVLMLNLAVSEASESSLDRE
jgi:potassium-transporting ATPase KdpC subunit